MFTPIYHPFHSLAPACGPLSSIHHSTPPLHTSPSRPPTPTPHPPREYELSDGLHDVAFPAVPRHKKRYYEKLIRYLNLEDILRVPRDLSDTFDSAALEALLGSMQPLLSEGALEAEVAGSQLTLFWSPAEVRTPASPAGHSRWLSTHTATLMPPSLCLPPSCLFHTICVHTICVHTILCLTPETAPLLSPPPPLPLPPTTTTATATPATTAPAAHCFHHHHCPPLAPTTTPASLSALPPAPPFNTAMPPPLFHS
jgi:hypothetical protein